MIGPIVVLLISLLTSSGGGGPAQPGPVEPGDPAAAHIGTVLIGGRASWVRPSLGDRYLAMRLPKGTVVRICGGRGCVVRIVNDYGPSSKIRPRRIADLSRADFVTVCGDPILGTCKVSAELLESIELPATDTDG